MTTDRDDHTPEVAADLLPEPVAVDEADTEGSDAPASARQRLLDMSRRRFLRTGSIGVVAAGVASSVPGLGSLLSTAEGDAPAVTGSASAAATSVEGSSPEVQSLVVRVSNAATGEMRIFAGNQTYAIRDSGLARQLSQAARAAGH